MALFNALLCSACKPQPFLCWPTTLALDTLAHCFRKYKLFNSMGKEREKSLVLDEKKIGCDKQKQTEKFKL